MLWNEDTCDHESDDEPSTVGYNDYGTDDENISAAAEQEDFVPRTELEDANWCKCSNCVTMESEIKCFCCRESSLISDSVLKDVDKCVTEISVFRKTIEEAEVLDYWNSSHLVRRELAEIWRVKLKQKALDTSLMEHFCKFAPLMYSEEDARVILFSVVPVW